MKRDGEDEPMWVAHVQWLSTLALIGSLAGNVMGWPNSIYVAAFVVVVAAWAYAKWADVKKRRAS